jgi:hypothetical protein
MVGYKHETDIFHASACQNKLFGKNPAFVTI